VPNTPSPGKTITPCPLLAHDLNHRRVFRYGDELGPYKQPGANIAATPTEVTMVSHHSSFLFSGAYSPVVLAVTVQETAQAMNRLTATKTIRDHEGDVHRVILIFQLDAIGVNHPRLRRWNRMFQPPIRPMQQPAPSRNPLTESSFRAGRFRSTLYASRHYMD